MFLRELLPPWVFESASANCWREWPLVECFPFANRFSVNFFLYRIPSDPPVMHARPQPFYWSADWASQRPYNLSAVTEPSSWHELYSPCVFHGTPLCGLPISEDCWEVQIDFFSAASWGRIEPMSGACGGTHLHCKMTEKFLITSASQDWKCPSYEG